MKQLSLFSDIEEARRKAIETLFQLQFAQSQKHWKEYSLHEPFDNQDKQAFFIIDFWKKRFDNNSLAEENSSVKLLSLWREFEKKIALDKIDESKFIFTQFKKNFFLKALSLENITNKLRKQFISIKTTALDLFIEIKDWERACKETENILLETTPLLDDLFWLKRAKVYYLNKQVKLSRTYLLKAFLINPDVIDISLIVDEELLDYLDDLLSIVENENVIVELLPYVCIINRLVTISNSSTANKILLSEINENIEKYQKIVFKKNERILFRLFSLYAWKADLLKTLGKEFTEPRQRMKRISPDLFQNYMEQQS